MNKKFCDKCNDEIIDMPLESVGFATDKMYGNVDYYIDLCENCKKELQRELQEVLLKYDCKSDQT